MCAGKQVKLSLAAEEVALFFAQMLDHDYTTKTVFQENFFTDWRKVKNNFWKKKLILLRWWWLAALKITVQFNTNNDINHKGDKQK